MKCEIRTCHVSDGFALKFRHFKAPGQSIDGRSIETGSGHADARPAKSHGVVVAVHGIQSHSGWYRESSTAIAGNGWDVYFADRRGSGLNGRDRGHADHGLRLLNDLKALVRLARNEHPGQPLALLGLSWGGKLATAFAATYPEWIQRLILLYPATDSKVGPNLRQACLLRFARHHDLRRRLVSLPFTDPAMFTNVSEFQQRIQNDPLALNAVTTGFLNATRDLDRIVDEQANRVIQPTLLMLAEEDRIVNNSKVRKRIGSWPVSDFSMIEYPGAEHTLEFCLQRETFFRDLTHWLNRSLPTDAIQVPETANQ